LGGHEARARRQTEREVRQTVAELVKEHPAKLGPNEPDADEDEREDETQ
jgi:hypothetical protein